MYDKDLGEYKHIERHLHTAVMGIELLRYSVLGIVALFKKCTRSQDFIIIHPSSLDSPTRETHCHSKAAPSSSIRWP